MTVQNPVYLINTKTLLLALKNYFSFMFYILHYYSRPQMTTSTHLAINLKIN